MNREIITIQKTNKGYWMKRFDDYETSFSRISKSDALELIKAARDRGDMFYDDDENKEGRYCVWGYWN